MWRGSGDVVDRYSPIEVEAKMMILGGVLLIGGFVMFGILILYAIFDAKRSGGFLRNGKQILVPAMVLSWAAFAGGAIVLGS